MSETEATERLAVEYEVPAGWADRRNVKLPGGELPAEVTAQPVTIGVFATTEGVTEQGRPYGWVSYSLNIGGRVNPQDLTQDEREYVARMLEQAAADFRNGHALGPDSVKPTGQ